MLRFIIHHLGDVTVFECTGRITVEAGNALRNAVLNQPYVPAVVLDLKEISDIDAAGLGALATLRTWAQSNGTELRLMNLMPRVERALELTGLKSVFRICSARDMFELLCRAMRQDACATAGASKRAAGF
ncbi:MAG TPA: STAS domain-containing protein [Candidatus Limnocylindrales bacterium]|nr:STAS domain-containing protein [Candidatus Limnocylindrales bacterium]